MSIDFTLTADQKKLQKQAREFSLEVLAPAIAKADREPDPQQAFAMMKQPYKEAYKLGYAMGFLPKEYGGQSIKNVDLQIVAEELCAVDPGFATIALINGLALMPLSWFGSKEQKQKWLTEAANDPSCEYLAGWTVSEPAGSPGGTANFDSPGVGKVGIGLVARHDKGKGEYVLNGRKKWPGNAGGWDLKGANVNVVVVRTDTSKGGKSGLSCALVPRGAPGVRYEQPIDKPAHRTSQNNDIYFEDCRIPEENLFAVGNGDLVISKTFTWSGPVAAIGSVGVARSAYEYVLNWAKTYTAGGSKPILNHQAVGYAMADVAMKIEACRAFAWKTAHYLDLHDNEGQAMGAMSKVLCGEMMLQSIYKAMQVMGVNSLDKAHPVERYMREALVFPIYDAGNLGMQMRKIWGVMLDDTFDPKAFADSKAIAFTKNMEGAGLSLDEPALSPALVAAE